MTRPTSEAEVDALREQLAERGKMIDELIALLEAFARGFDYVSGRKNLFMDEVDKLKADVEALSNELAAVKSECARQKEGGSDVQA